MRSMKKEARPIFYAYYHDIKAMLSLIGEYKVVFKGRGSNGVA